jgi:hypothetical protein
MVWVLYVGPDRLFKRLEAAGSRHFPRNARLAYKVATLYKRFGYPEDAARVIGRSLRLAEAPESRALLASFVARDR